MIYFLQDEGTLHIKIGLTDGTSADARLRTLQTGNPSLLLLLGTMPGDRDTERRLHRDFASARVAGEWFRAVPALLSLILEQRAIQATEAARSCVLPSSSGTLPKTIAFYLAGKIDKNCWRHDIVRDLRGALAEQISSCPSGETPSEPYWPFLTGAVLIGDASHDYVGPFFASCDHGCFHGEDTHGLAAQGLFADETYVDRGTHSEGGVEGPETVLALCLKAIHAADVLFAWIDQLDCYGTITEIGYAKALGKTIWIAGPRRIRDMWFVYEAAGTVDFLHQSAPLALSAIMKRYCP